MSDQATPADTPNSFRTGPDDRGHFGIYGGRFVAETLMPNVLQLEEAYRAAKKDPPWLLIGGGVFGGLVLILLLVAIARGGGGKRRRR